MKTLMLSSKKILLLGLIIAASGTAFGSNSLLIKSPANVPTCQQFFKENPSYHYCYPIRADIPKNKAGVNTHVLVVKYNFQPNEWVLYSGQHGIMASQEKSHAKVKVSRAMIKNNEIVNKKEIYNRGVGINLIGLTCSLASCY